MAFLKRDPDNNQFDYEASIQISRILKILSDTTKNTEIIVSLSKKFCYENTQKFY